MKNCLIVDDSIATCKVFRRIAQTLGYDSGEAQSHSEGLEACRKNMPDAVVLDWNMPDGDGLTFLRELRKLPGGDKPKVLYCMSERDALAATRAVRCGANGHFLKPFDQEVVTNSFAEMGLV